MTNTTLQDLPSPSWYTHESREGEGSSRIRVDVRFASRKPRGYVRLLWISLNLETPWLAALGDAWESPETAIPAKELEVRLGENLGAIPVGYRVEGGKKTAYFYLGDVGRYRDAIVSVMGAFPSVEYDYGLERDKDWKAYEALLPE